MAVRVGPSLRIIFPLGNPQELLFVVMSNISTPPSFRKRYGMTPHFDALAITRLTIRKTPQSLYHLNALQMQV